MPEVRGIKRVRIKGHRYYLNREKATRYVVRHSMAKLVRMVDLIPEAQCVFDVGANCGIFSALCASRFPRAQVYAFEPAPGLRDALALNCASPNITTRRVAVGDCEEMVTLYINPQSQQTNSLHRSAIEPFTNRIGEQSVPCLSLDSLGISPDVLKVDVQGGEGAVFRGAKATLQSVEYLFIESSWLDPDTHRVVPTARHYGFTHVSVINPVHMGADLLFTRGPVSTPPDILCSEISAGKPWF